MSAQRTLLRFTVPDPCIDRDKAIDVDVISTASNTIGGKFISVNEGIDR